MNVNELIPKPADRVRFTLRYQKHTPGVPGCYALATYDDEILYVGLSENLRRRFGEHRESDDKRNPTSLGFAFWFYWLEIDQVELLRTERSWINQHLVQHGVRPLLNKVDSPVW